MRKLCLQCVHLLSALTRPLSGSCALQYVLLHLLGYKLTMDDLKQFRQLGSKTPGHPEAGHTDGKSYRSLARQFKLSILFRY